jgi:hypothetical protein
MQSASQLQCTIPFVPYTLKSAFCSKTLQTAKMKKACYRQCGNVLQAYKFMQIDKQKISIFSQEKTYKQYLLVEGSLLLCLSK